ncbi:transposase [Methylacidimicrobium sp. B4]|uniref:transposase n=1 Tax=Methylacidimicrobium sp. B4 TaxID=2796139 RepID=UPI0021051964|nr:transposase [Methylacidimicrobium sp. B4]
MREMQVPRIFGIALGYEALNDHEQLHIDPLVALLSGKRDRGEDLAGKSTLEPPGTGGSKRTLPQDRFLSRNRRSVIGRSLP